MAGRHGLSAYDWHLPGFSPRGERIGRALTALTSWCMAGAAVYAALTPTPPVGLATWLRSPWDRTILVATGVVFLALGLEVVLAGPPRPHPPRRAVWVFMLRRGSLVGIVLVGLAMLARSVLQG
jgi:hypothetical protein